MLDPHRERRILAIGVVADPVKLDELDLLILGS